MVACEKSQSYCLSHAVKRCSINYLIPCATCPDSTPRCRRIDLGLFRFGWQRSDMSVRSSLTGRPRLPPSANADWLIDHQSLVAQLFRRLLTFIPALLPPPGLWTDILAMSPHIPSCPVKPFQRRNPRRRRLSSSWSPQFELCLHPKSQKGRQYLSGVQPIRV